MISSLVRLGVMSKVPQVSLICFFLITMHLCSCNKHALFYSLCRIGLFVEHRNLEDAINQYLDFSESGSPKDMELARLNVAKLGGCSFLDISAFQHNLGLQVPGDGDNSDVFNVLLVAYYLVLM
jgi:hypothetical protein